VASRRACDGAGRSRAHERKQPCSGCRHKPPAAWQRVCGRWLSFPLPARARHVGTPRVVVLSADVGCRWWQVREQDLNLQRATARLEATSLAFHSARANLDGAAVEAKGACPVHDRAGTALHACEGDVDCPSLTPDGGLSAAHGFYLQLKSSCRRRLLSDASSTLDASLSHSLDESRDSTESMGRQAGDALAALKLSVADAVAENLALSRVSHAGGFCCSFTTRHCGTCARIHVVDALHAEPHITGGSDQAPQIVVSSDLDLAGACQHARALHAKGLCADAVVRQALWPELAARAEQTPSRHEH
jgi:hypothetical protein